MSMHQVNPISGMLHLPELPYDKRDLVAAAEKSAYAAAHKLKPSKPTNPAVPARACLYASSGCDLRARGKCDSRHCSIAYEYEAQLAGGGQ